MRTRSSRARSGLRPTIATLTTLACWICLSANAYAQHDSEVCAGQYPSPTCSSGPETWNTSVAGEGTQCKTHSFTSHASYTYLRAAANGRARCIAQSNEDCFAYPTSDAFAWDTITIDAPGLTGHGGSATLTFEIDYSGNGTGPHSAVFWQVAVEGPFAPNFYGQVYYLIDEHKYGNGEPFAGTYARKMDVTFGTPFLWHLEARAIALGPNADCFTYDQWEVTSSCATNLRIKGISDFRDSNGDSVADATITSKSGTDYASPQPPVVFIDDATTQDELDALADVPTTVFVALQYGESLSIPNLTSVTGDYSIKDNPNLALLSIENLATVGGSVDISDCPLLDSVNLPALGDVDGDVTVSGNAGAESIDLGALSTVGGGVSASDNKGANQINLGVLSQVGSGVSVNGNAGASTINLGELSTVGGGVSVSDNLAATTIDLGALGGVGGDVVVRDNPSATEVDLGALGEVGGDVRVSDNPSASQIDLGALGTVGADIVVADNPSATAIDLGALGGVGGDVIVTENWSASGIDLGALGSVGGDVKITDNPSASDINLASLTTVGGNMTLETQLQSSVDLSAVAVAGNLDLNSSDALIVSAVTTGGTTDVTLANTDATLHLELPEGAFIEPVTFTIEHLDAADLPPQDGTDAEGHAALIDLVIGYELTFSTTTLEKPGELTLEVIVDGLDQETRDAFLNALAAGTVALSVQSDADGSEPVALAVCQEGEEPGPDGCVALTLLDADHVPLPPDSQDPPAFVQAYAIVTHFSTYGVAIVTPHESQFERGDVNCDGGVNFDDIDSFVTALISRDDYESQHPDCNYLNADINQDNAVNFEDIDGFVECLINNGCP